MNRNDFIARPFLGMLQIINKKSGARQNVVLVAHQKSRRLVRKNDRRHLFTATPAYTFALWLNESADEANFIALCHHFTGGPNYYDRQKNP